MERDLAWELWVVTTFGVHPGLRKDWEPLRIGRRIFIPLGRRRANNFLPFIGFSKRPF